MRRRERQVSNYPQPQKTAEKEKLGVVLRTESDQYVNNIVKYDVALSTNNFERGITLTEEGLVFIEHEGFYQVSFSCIISKLPENSSTVSVIKLSVSADTETNQPFTSFPCHNFGNFMFNTIIKCNKGVTLSIVVDDLVFISRGATLTITPF